MANENVKLTTDTSQSQQAMQTLKASWINAAAGMTVIEKAFNHVGGALAGVNKLMNDSATFMDAVKDEAGVAAVQMAMAVTEGQIRPMELARQQNVLMRGSLRLTQEQFDLVAKAAVALSDEIGGDANSAFADLSKSLVTGTTKSLAQFGIQIEEGGTKAEKTAKVMEYLSETYGGYSVEVGGAADATEKMNNQIDMQRMLAARSFDGISKMLSKFKTFYMTEFLPGIVDSIAGTKWSVAAQQIGMINKLTDEAAVSQGAAAKSAIELRNALEQLNGMKYDHRAAGIEKEREQLKLLAIEWKIVSRAANSDYVDEFGENAFRIEEKLKLKAQELYDLQKRAFATLKPENMTLSEKNELLAKTVNLARLGIIQNQQAVSDAEKASALANATGKGMENQAKWNTIIIDGRAEIARLSKLTAEADRQQELMLSGVAAQFSGLLPLAEKFARLMGVGTGKDAPPLPKSGKTSAGIAVDLQAEANKKMKEMEKRRDEEMAASRKKKQDDAQAIGEKNRETLIANYDKEQTILQAALDKKKAAEKVARDKKYEEDLAAYNKDLEARKAYVAKTTELVTGLAQVSLNAIFAEKKARDGLSKSDYMMKQLAVYMRGQALKYAADAIGHTAGGFASLYWNPAGAAALFTAAKFDAAAAVAYGLGSASASAMAGSGSSGSSGSSGKQTTTGAPTKEAVAGTKEQRGNLTIVVGKDAFIIGTVDELMRKINGGLNDARRRGVL